MIKSLVSKYLASQKATCEIRATDLELLHAVTDRLPSWGQRWAGNGDRIVEVEVESGKSITKGLHKVPELAIALVESVAGTVYACHSHEQEYLVVVSGRVDLEFKDGTTIYLLPGDDLMIPAWVEHTAVFPIDTVAVAITIPAAAAFPGGGRFSERPADKPAAI